MSTVENYRSMLLSLFPPGLAWPREPGSIVYKFAYGAAEELKRIHDRALQLIEESDPRTTNEMLSDWERALGLPDDCSPEDATTIQRRFEVVQRYKASGGQSRQYFIDFAAALGFTITITEFRQFEVGRSVVGEALTNGDWVFAWQISAAEFTVFNFSAGLSAVGDPLATWGNDVLECKLDEAKPAHTVLIFTYS